MNVHPVVVEINAKLVWRAQRTKAGNYIAACDAMALTAFGETWPELQAAIAEIIQEVFLDLLEESSLERFLRDRGWKMTGPVPPRQAIPDVLFNVPYEVQREGDQLAFT